MLFALHLDIPAKLFDNTVGNGKPKAGSVFFFGGKKRLEDMPRRKHAGISSSLFSPPKKHTEPALGFPLPTVLSKSLAETSR